MKNSPSTPDLFEVAFSVGKQLDSIYNTEMNSLDFDKTVRELQTQMAEVQTWLPDGRERLYQALQGLPYDNLGSEEVVPVLKDLMNCNI